MASRGATTGISLIKRAWNEIPEIVCCIGMIGIGVFGVTVGTYRYSRDVEKKHMYRYTYHVVRTSDVDPTKEIYN